MVLLNANSPWSCKCRIREEKKLLRIITNFSVVLHDQKVITGHFCKNTTLAGQPSFRSVQTSRARMAVAAAGDIACLTVNHSLFSSGLGIVFHTLNSIEQSTSGPQKASETMDILKVPAHPGDASRPYLSLHCWTSAPRSFELPVSASEFSSVSYGSSTPLQAAPAVYNIKAKVV